MQSRRTKKRKIPSLTNVLVDSVSLPAPFFFIAQPSHSPPLCVADSCADIRIYESDAASTLDSSSSSAGGSPLSLASATSSTGIPSIPALSLDASSDFQSECTQSLARAFDEGHTVDNAAIELKTLRMASNVPLPRVREAVVAFLIGRVGEGLSAPEAKAELKKVLGRWGALVRQIGGYDEAETLLMFQVSPARMGLSSVAIDLDVWL